MESARKKPGCRFFLLDHHRTTREVLEIGGWGLDGLIVSLENANLEIIDAVVALNLPVVNIGTAPVDFPSVSVSAKSVAKLVADHLEGRLVTSLKFISTAHHQRLANTLAQEAANRKWKFHHVETEFCDSTMLDPTLRNRFARSIAAVGRTSKHVAIVTSCDLIAVGVSQLVQHAANDLGLSALISCRESLLCGMPDDSITAVQEPSYELGLEAARIMESLLNGRVPAKHSTLDAKE